MIISRTPLRISFVGGGSDIPSYYHESPGAVVTTAINKYIYITVNKKFDNKIRASYSRTEIVNHRDGLQHEIIKSCLKLVGIDGGIEITSISDIPSEGTGLGSSSSYTVGLLHALYAYIGKYVSAKQLATEACRIELDILKKPIGKQDQFIAAYGGLNYLQFYSDEQVEVSPIICKFTTKKHLQEHLILLYTNLTRSADTILSKQTENLKKDMQKRSLTKQMVGLSEEMLEHLNKNNIRTFGRLLDENWRLKQQMAAGITNSKIDNWYAIAKECGAEGGKILGAGGGGFLLLFAEPKNHKKIVKSLPDLSKIDFNFEPQGSKIIFVSE